MKIKVTNFGSYKDFSFDFNNLGLCLLYGDTGSGKSTLQDMVSWILFGITSKNGSVDEVRNWDNLAEVTTGWLSIQTAMNTIRITRIRGSATQNDLYWQEEYSDSLHRGKTISDTQTLLESRLGLSKETFLMGSYFNEFSATGRFFTDTARNRRQLFEQIADLSFPNDLSIKLLKEQKKIKKYLETLDLDLAKENRSLQDYFKNLARHQELRDEWKRTQIVKLDNLLYRYREFDHIKQNKINELQNRFYEFEQLRVKRVESLHKNIKEAESVDLITNHATTTLQLQQAQELKKTCPTCGLSVSASHQVNLLTQLNTLDEQLHRLKESKRTHKEWTEKQNPFAAGLFTEKHTENHYKLQHDEELKVINPYENIITETHTKITELSQNVDRLTSLVISKKSYLNDVITLIDLTVEFRAKLLQNAILEVQYETNQIFSEFFDGAFQLEMCVQDDDLSLVIQKDGRECSYTQLSKGQRQLLKLAFTIAVMKRTVAESGGQFSTIMLDEALDGLDTAFKLKAYRLFEELSLSYPTIMLIDHSEVLQSFFNNKYQVSLINGFSEVKEI